jgi:hypothetical protein
MKLKVLLIAVGVVQLVLGVAYLFAPHALLQWMGHSLPAADINYPFGMLAARFLAYGLGMLVIARAPAQHTFWIKNMVFIQMIDLAVGLFYTMAGTVSLQLSAFPMFNAMLIAVLLWVWRPRVAPTSSAA